MSRAVVIAIACVAWAGCEANARDPVRDTAPPPRADAWTGPGDAPLVKGALAIDQVAPVLRGVIPPVRACDPSGVARGKVVVTWTVAADGAVSHVATRFSTLGDAELDACIADRFRELVFPPAPAGTELSYRLEFR